MANHKSAKKRARQTLKRRSINIQVLSQLKTNISKFYELIQAKNIDEINKSSDILFQLIDSNQDQKISHDELKELKSYMILSITLLDC